MPHTELGEGRRRLFNPLFRSPKQTFTYFSLAAIFTFFSLFFPGSGEDPPIITLYTSIKSYLQVFMDLLELDYSSKVPLGGLE